MRVDRYEIFQPDDEGGAERRPEQRPAAAQRDHQQDLDRGGQLQVGRADEAVVVRPQHAREPAHAARDDETEVLVQPHVIAERPHARLALADAHERLPERRAHDRAQDDEGQKECDEREIVEGDALAERPGKAQLGAWHARDAVVALGQRHPAMRQAPHDHAEGQRDHQKVDAGRPQGDEPEERRHRRRQQDADHERDPEGRAVSRRQDAHAVGPEPQIGGVAQRGEAGVAEDDVEAHGEDGVDDRLGQERQQERGEERGRHEQRQERDEDRDAHHARPKRPVGRTARIAAIGANSVK